MNIARRASSWCARSQLEKALADAEKLVEADAANSDRRYSRGYPHVALGQDQQALESFERAVLIDGSEVGLLDATAAGWRLPP